MALSKFILVSLLVICVSCMFANVSAKEYTPVEQCGSEKLFKNVAIYSRKGLCTKLPCQFKLGETLKVEIEFKNKNRIEKIVSKCKAKVMGSEVDFPIPDSENGCAYLTNAKCPVAPNTDLEMVLNIPVKTPAAMEQKISVDVKMQFSLLDQNKDLISCFQVLAKVQI